MAASIILRRALSTQLTRSARTFVTPTIIQNRRMTMYYTESHEWVNVVGETAKIGITDHAQAALGDVVFVDLPEVDTEIDAGDEISSVESVKAVGDVGCPIGGVVTAVNEELEATPALINSDPEIGGWICEMKVTDDSALAGLMDLEAYLASLEH